MFLAPTTTADRVADIVARLPATDKEAAPDYKPAEGKPAPSSKFTAPAPEVAGKLVDELLAGGEAALGVLIELVRDGGAADFRDYKAEYLLHLVVLRAGDPGQESLRKMAAASLAAYAAKEATLPGVRPILLRELQWVADGESCAAIGELLADPKLCDAASAVVRVVGGAPALAACRQALGKASGSCRLTVLHALADLADAESAAAFRAALKEENADLRLTGARGLVRIADEASAGALVNLAAGAGGYERSKATHLCLQLAEKLAAAGKKAAASGIYQRLAKDWTAPQEKHIRDAAEKALKALS